MKSFQKFISEEVLPTAMVQDGSFDLENEVVRDQINMILAGICSHSHVTPYVTLRKVSKALAYFSIILPKKTFLEGRKGIEVYEMMQFGERMGMTDQGEFVREVPTKFYLFFDYRGMLGMFSCMAKVVSKAELDKLLDMAEVTLGLHEDAECRQNSAKASAPKEEMQDITDDEKKVGNKKAVAASEKKSLDETRMPASVIKHKQRIANMTPEERAKKFAGKSQEELKAMARRHGFGKDSNEYSKHVKEEQIDEVSKGKAIRAYAAGSTYNYDDEHPKSDAIKSHIVRKFGKKAGEHADKASHVSLYGRDNRSNRVDQLAHAKPSSEMRKTKSGKIHKQDVASKKSEIKFRKDMSKFDAKRGHLPEETISEKHLSASEKSKKESEVMKLKPHLKGFKERYGAKKGESVMYGVATNRAKEMDESMLGFKKDYGYRALKRKVSTQVKAGLGLTNQSNTIQVSRKNDPSRKVIRISKDQFDPTKHVKV